MANRRVIARGPEDGCGSKGIASTRELCDGSTVDCGGSYINLHVIRLHRTLHTHTHTPICTFTFSTFIQSKDESLKVAKLIFEHLFYGVCIILSIAAVIKNDASTSFLVQ